MKTFRSSLMLAAMLAAGFPAAALADDADILSRPDVQAKIQYCKDCHGASGQGFRGAYPVPRLAGQTVPYLEAKFEVITEHRRDNPTAAKFMEPALGSVDPAIRRAVATYFSGLKAAPAGGAPKELAGAGKKIYEKGVPEANVPVCASCHGEGAKGTEAAPRLAGQLCRDTMKVLGNWAVINKDRGGNGGPAGVKAPVEHRLSEDQISAVAAYVSDLD